MNNPTEQPSQIAGFWRRLFAFILDIFVLGLFGSFLGFFLYDNLASIGGLGRIVGFVIALTYFGLMNSRILRGQTIGKRIMKINVVSTNGKFLSVAASFSRSCILCVPYFLNGAPFHMDLINSWFGFILVFLVFGIGLSIVYLFVFNRKTRQSLHDLAVGSYVVRTGVETAPLGVGIPWRGHFAVVVAIMATAAVVPMFTGRLAKTEPFASLLPLQKALESEPGVQYVSLNVGTTSFASIQNGSHSSTSLSTHVVADSKNIDQEALANKIAQIELSSFADASKKDIVAVSISYGYDIGIASASRSQNFSFSPAKWRERLAPQSNNNVQPTGAGNAPTVEIKL